MNKKVLISLLLFFLFLIFFYIINFNKNNNYATNLNSINLANIEKINKLKAELNSFDNTQTIVTYNNNLSSFINSILIFQKTIVENNYPTLQGLLSRYRDNLKDASSLNTIVDEMKNVIRDSSLQADIKINLYKEIRNFSIAYEDLLKNQNSINKNLKTIDNLLLSSIEEFSNSEEKNNTLAKLSNIEDNRFRYNTILIVVLILSFIIIYFELYNLKNNLKKEYNKIIETLDAIKQSYNTELLFKLKTSNFFNRLKNNLFETLKTFSNKIDFYKDYIYYHKIPIKYKDDNNHETKNKAYLDLEKKVKLNDFFAFEDRYFKRYKDNNYEFYTYIDKINLINNVENDFITELEKENFTLFGEKTKIFISHIKANKTKKEKYFNKYMYSNKRLKNIISTYKNLKVEFSKLENSITKANSETNVCFIKVANLKNNINKIDSLVSNIIYKIDLNNSTFNNINDLKNYFKQNLEKINLLKLEFETVLNKLDAHYKSLIVNNVDIDIDILKELKANFSTLIKDANTLKLVLLNFDLSLNQINIDSSFNFDELKLNITNLNKDVDDISKTTT